VLEALDTDEVNENHSLIAALAAARVLSGRVSRPLDEGLLGQFEPDEVGLTIPGLRLAKLELLIAAVQPEAARAEAERLLDIAVRPATRGPKQRHCPIWSPVTIKEVLLVSRRAPDRARRRHRRPRRLVGLQCGG
jgi:hypothetical protein